MEANLIDNVARLTLSADADTTIAGDCNHQFNHHQSHDVSFSLEDIVPSGGGDVDTKVVIETQLLTPRNDRHHHHHGVSPYHSSRAMTGGHKRSSSFLVSTPTQLPSSSELYLPTPLVSNRNHYHTGKRRRSNNDDSHDRHDDPMVPDPHGLDHVVEVRPSYFPPFLESSSLLEESRDDRFVKNHSNHDDDDLEGNCHYHNNNVPQWYPSKAPSLTGSLEGLPFLDHNSPSLSPTTRRVRVLRMRTTRPGSQHHHNIPPTELFGQPAV